MVVIDNGKHEEAVRQLGANIDYARIPMSVYIFMKAGILLSRLPYVIITDAEGNDIMTRKWQSTTYVHSYKYTGELDLWFLNQYETLILRGCNEYSVELCLTALNEWRGKRILFVGEDWKYLIESLPELEGKECIWEDELADELLNELPDGEKFLDIRIGNPHAETMDRYYKNIMTYDEVMTFTYLFSQKRELGEKNPDKKFFIIDAGYENLGLFTLFHYVESVAKYVKKRGYIPVVWLKIEYGIKSIYQNFVGDDIWAKFYNQPENFGIEDILESKSIYFPPVFYTASIMKNIMDKYSEDVDLSWSKGIYNQSISEYLEEKSKIFLPYPEKTLGVLARGTDYVNTHLANHSVHASKEQLGEKIEELMKKWGLGYCFIATEDEGYFEYFKARFGEKAFFTDQERYKVKPGEMLAEMHRKNPEKEDGWKLGADYILAIYLLSRCNSFLASGGCSGVGEARNMNKGKWKNEFVFNLGINKQ